MKRITLLTAALMFAGCSDASNTCTEHSDCFSGEFCVAGACGPDAPTTNNSTSGGTNNKADTSNNSTNNFTNNSNNASTNNSTNSSNNATNNSTNNATNNSTNNATNNSTNNATNNSTTTPIDGSYESLRTAYPDSACVVDVFSAVCTTPDDNGSFATYLPSGNGAGGCLSGDTANPIDFTNSLEMCAIELKDKYQTNVVPCDTTDFILEVFLTPKIKCDPALYSVDLVLSGTGRSCSDNDPTFKCKFEADGSWHAQVIVSPQNSVLSANVTIESAYPNVIDFDYDLRYLTRN